MRASYALPGVFEPVTCNGRVLVDGALVNPVPVSVCRAYEQPLVVAVNLHYDLYGRAAVIKHSAGELVVERDATPGRRPPIRAAREARLGITGVMVEAFNIIQDRISRARLAGDPPDLSLQPKLGHIGLSEFHRADEAIQHRLRGHQGPDRRAEAAADRARPGSQLLRPCGRVDRCGIARCGCRSSNCPTAIRRHESSRPCS